MESVEDIQTLSELDDWVTLSEEDITSDLSNFEFKFNTKSSIFSDIANNFAIPLLSKFKGELFKHVEDEHEIEQLMRHHNKSIEMLRDLEILKQWIMVRKVSIVNHLKVYVLSNHSDSLTPTAQQIILESEEVLDEETCELMKAFSERNNIKEHPLITEKIKGKEAFSSITRTMTQPSEGGNTINFEFFFSNSPFYIEIEQFSPVVATQMKDLTEHQSIRDIERDVISINGQVVQGSVGFDQILFLMRQEIIKRSCLFDTILSHPNLQSTLRNFCKLILQAVNRTESGGLSFEAIRHILELDQDEEACTKYLIVPKSKDAKPLSVSFCLGPMTQTNSAIQNAIEHVDWSVTACIEATTVYSVYSGDMESCFCEIQATFLNDLSLAISPPNLTNVVCFEDIGYQAGCGKIVLDIKPFLCTIRP